MTDNNSGTLWQSLTLEQQRDVLEAFEESEYEENLIPLSEMISKFASEK